MDMECNAMVPASFLDSWSAMIALSAELCSALKPNSDKHDAWLQVVTPGNMQSYLLDKGVDTTLAGLLKEVEDFQVVVQNSFECLKEWSSNGHI